MAPTSAAEIVIPIFGGQGAWRFAKNQEKPRTSLPIPPYASLLLSECHRAFHAEYLSVGTELSQKLVVHIPDFQEQVSLLCPPAEQYHHNSAIMVPSLLLSQCFHYLSYIEQFPAVGSPSCLTTILEGNRQAGVGILGFSSGIIAACVVSTSRSILDFINHAVEAYRLAIWIGIRAQIYRLDTLGETNRENVSASWSVVTFGLTERDAQQIIREFNQKSVNRIYLTAVTDIACLTISGHPTELRAFVGALPPEIHVHHTSIGTLYHSPLHSDSFRPQILADVKRQQIAFPNFCDIIVPIRSTFTGGILDHHAICSGSLVEVVIDMLLIQPVNWDLVVRSARTNIGQDVSVCILELGAAFSLAKGFEKALSGKRVTIIPVTDHGSLPPQRNGPEPIAIIGMAVNMPGASTVMQLWDVLANGLNTSQEIPRHRFDHARYTTGDKSGRTMRARHGNFINDADGFDHGFFNISPREAKSMDPQQRILLHVAYEALEDAGFVPHSTPCFDPQTFGCFVGSATHDYLDNLRNDIDVYYSTGTLKAFLSGRLSHSLGLGGPSIVVDTACSSSVVALYQASRALMHRDCNAALVGGVNIISSPDMFIGLDRGHFLSPSGRCKSFDTFADGYCRAEGCGLFVLKRLSDAVAENDRILGVIRNVQVNQSCNACSIMQPHCDSQERLFKELFSSSLVDPHIVNLVEAHGTGTQAGDVSEVESIRRVLCLNRSADNPLYITSIKANIGHLEAASGCASLAKVLLMFREKVIPQQIALECLNPKITPLSLDNAAISTSNIPWLPSAQGQPRTALVNNFGAAGSNAAVLVEEYVPSSSAQCPPPPGTSYVVGMSAKSQTALSELRTRYVDWLRGRGHPAQEISISDLAYTSTARRQIYPYRLAITACTPQELSKRLMGASFVEVSTEQTQVIFVFSGQGSQYRGMGNSLYQTSPIFRRHVEECNDILVSFGFSEIISTIRDDVDGHPLVPAEAECLQLATFTLEYALAKLWMFWGLQPVVVVGHSLGEYAALVTASVLTLRDALVIVGTRARLMEKKCPPWVTGMLAVSLEPVKLQVILNSKREFSGLSISCFNSPHDCVVSGAIAQLDILKGHLDVSEKCRNVRLPVPHGYHSPAMFPIVEDLGVLSGSIKIGTPSLPIISTVLGHLILPGDRNCITANYFSRHSLEPVNFDKGIRSFLSSVFHPRKTVWLEIGPHPTVIPLLKAFPALSNAVMLCSLRRKQDSWESLSSSLASLYLGNHGIAWRAVFSQMGATSCISLPFYPFSKQGFWIPFKERCDKSWDSELMGPHSMIQKQVQSPTIDNGRIAMFETPLEHFKQYMTGHRVADAPLCPASVYLECALAGITSALTLQCLYPRGFHILLADIEFTKPLIWDDSAERRDSSLIVIVNCEAGSFTIKSCFRSEKEALHAGGNYSLQPGVQIASTLLAFTSAVEARITDILRNAASRPADSFSSKAIYDTIFPRVVTYSKDFQTVRSLNVNLEEKEAVAQITRPHGYDEDSTFVVHPFLVDTLLHVTGFLANMQGSLDDVFICHKTGCFTILPSFVDIDADYTVYCKILWLPDQSGIQGEAYILSTTAPRVMIASIEDIRFRRVHLATLKTGFAASNRMKQARSGWAEKPELHLKDQVIQLVAEVCHVEPDEGLLSADLGQLGDSFMRLRLRDAILDAFPGMEMKQNQVFGCRNVGDIFELMMAKSPITTKPNPYPNPPRVGTHESIEHALSIRSIVAAVLELDEALIGEDTELLLLGLDSLAAIEVLHALRCAYGLHFPAEMSDHYETIRELRTYISTQHPKLLPSPRIAELTHFNHQGSLVHIQVSDNSRTPLVLVHDGSGAISSYNRILPLDRNVWGIKNPRIANDASPWNSLTEMAAQYAEYIAVVVEGPVIVGGWSFGGVVAFEIARQLQARMSGVAVKGIILIDSPCPYHHIPLSPALLTNDPSLIANPDLRGHVAEQFLISGRLLCDYDPGLPLTEPQVQRLQPHLPPTLFLQCQEAYTPPDSIILGPEGGEPISIPRWLSDPSSMTREWEVLFASGVKPTVMDIAGNHFQVFDGVNVGKVSACLDDACGILDGDLGIASGKRLW